MRSVSAVILIVLLLSSCLSGQRCRMIALLDEADSLKRSYAQLPFDTLLREAADTLGAISSTKGFSAASPPSSRAGRKEIESPRFFCVLYNI